MAADTKGMLDSYFNIEATHRVQEWQRLGDLWHNMLWYNFEVSCREWMQPWPPTKPESTLSLPTYRIVQDDFFRDVWRVTTRYYYYGSVMDASRVPLQVLCQEIKDAYDEMIAADENRHTTDDWAPGGLKYLELLASQTAFSDGDTSEHGTTAPRCRECDDLERRERRVQY